MPARNVYLALCADDPRFARRLRKGDAANLMGAKWLNLSPLAFRVPSRASGPGSRVMVPPFFLVPDDADTKVGANYWGRLASAGAYIEDGDYSAARKELRALLAFLNLPDTAKKEPPRMTALSKEIATDLFRALEDGWVSAWNVEDGTYTIDHHGEDGDERRTEITEDDYAEAKRETSYTGPDAVLCCALNDKGRTIRVFGHADDHLGWGDLETPDPDDFD